MKPPVYCLDAPDAVTQPTQQWREICPVGKPLSVNSLPLNPEQAWSPELAADWLQVLKSRPEILDSVDVLDDLRAIVNLHDLAASPGAVDRCLVPLLERGVAILDQALTTAPADIEMPWAMLENRPALRLLVEYTIWLLHNDETAAAQRRMQQYLALNPHDNHGMRALLIGRLLCDHDDRAALTLAEQYPDDIDIDMTFGRVLALYRLGYLDAAAHALHTAHDINGHVIDMLRRKKVRQPEMSEYGITVGGKDSAWLYREFMRDVWVATDGLLDWARQTLR